MLANISYVPYLKTRVSEVEAFNFLSVDTKDRIFPLFDLRPWPNAAHISLCIERVTAAVSGRPFALGLDRERFNHTSTLPAQSEFNELFDQTGGFEFYYDFLSDIQGAVPVLQSTLDADNLLRQLGNAADLDRGLVVHQRRGSTIPISETIIGLPPLPDDTIFVVDAGWSRDPLQMESWALTSARRIVELLPSAEIVIMGSSFPSSFAHIVGSAEESAHEFALFENIRQQLQQADLTYGDWASTRLSQSGGGGSIPPRIDLPKTASWQIFRADPELPATFENQKETYGQLASDMQEDSSFAATPDCWGKLQIAATDGDGLGVTGVKKNTSCRINTHMTIASGSHHTLDTDETPYED